MNKYNRFKAISLLSGGLDSTLATQLILKQGIEVEAVNFFTVFCNCTARGKTCLASESSAAKLGVRLRVFEVSEEYLNIVKDPKHGYGSNMNPCIDCRIFMFKKAGDYMRRNSASFVVTGEVLGERPMSQRKDAMKLIEKESGLNGLILRPLSAKLLEPTIPEKEGLVDREKLLAIRGRSRKPQIELAKELNVKDYPCPAGGCLLTDPSFAARMRDLLKYKPDFTLKDVRLLKVGRHFRLTSRAGLVVGRDENENETLLRLKDADDICFRPARVKGPIGIGRGYFDQNTLALASQIIVRYSDSLPGDKIKVMVENQSSGKVDPIIIDGIDETNLQRLRIAEI